MQKGDFVRVKAEWLDKGENPNKLYIVRDIWSIDGGLSYRGEFQEIEPSTAFGCSSWVWDIKTMQVYMTSEEYSKIVKGELQNA